MATKERKPDPALAVAKAASANRLMDKLKAAHRDGKLKPVNPDAKPVTEKMRVKKA